MKFIDVMKEEYYNQMKLIYPDRIDELKEFIDKEIDSSITDKNVIFDDQVNKQEISLLEFSNKLEVERPILSNYGTIYRRHDEGVNLLLQMVAHLLNSRKEARNLRNEHADDIDRTIYNNLDLMQLTYKLLANSFYGVTVERNSIFYNPFFGSSITYSGVNIITTAINAFELFMSNNFKFNKLNDLLLYIVNIQNETYSHTDIINRDITKIELYDYLSEKMVDLTQEISDILIDLIKTMDQETINKIYYKNNIYEFYNNDIIVKILSNVAGNHNFMDAGDPPKDIEEDLELLWEYTKEWVFYNYLNFYRFSNADKGKRQTVLVVDTDSNFLMLDPFLKFVRDKFPERIKNTNHDRVSTINIATFILTKIIGAVYENLTKELNVPKEARHHIEMENENIYRRMMNTRNKKNYSGLIIHVEGHMLEEPDVEIKGMAIRKVSVNSKIREYFTNLLEHQVLKDENINLGKVFGSFANLENEIEQSLLSGNIEYAIPGRVNELDSYKFPYRIQSLRGSIIWDELFPNDTISLPTKVNMLKLTIESLEDIEGKVPDDVYTIIKETIFDDEELARYGFKVLSMPQKVTKIPSWITPFIDTSTMINDHVKSGIIILESLGFKTLDILTSQFPTNIIDF